MKQYSRMSDTELLLETDHLRREAKRKIQEGKFHEVDVLEQQYYFAKSYLMDPKKIALDATYHVHGEAGIFKISYINGIMAWGKINNEDPEVAFPIARLYQPGSSQDRP